MRFSIPVRQAARIVRAGGVIAYPTEGVYGLGCLPGDAEAVARILSIKQRDPGMGLVLIAASQRQLRGWVAATLPEPGAPGADNPVTWIAPAADDVPYWIRGDHQSVAVRLTAHPVAAALCNAAGDALVSTSANISGHPPTRNRFVLRRNFDDLVDYIVPGDCGPAKGPSEIRELGSGRIVRPAAT